MKPNTCPICQGVARKQIDRGGGVFWVECEICGAYDITTLFEAILISLQDRSLMPYLSSATRQSASRLTLTSDNWQALAEAQRGTPVDHKLRSLLELVAGKTAAAGEWVVINPRQACPLLAARDTAEFDYFATHLGSLGHLERRLLPVPGTADGDGGFREWTHEFRLTISGLNAVSPLGAGVSGTCFVAMSFHPSLAVAYDNGILPAVATDCGFRVLRVDRLEHNDSITDKIIAGIRSNDFAKTLLVKRLAFKHEREARLLFFADRNRNQIKEGRFHYPIEPHKFIEQIMIDPRVCSGHRRRMQEPVAFHWRSRRSRY